MERTSAPRDWRGRFDWYIVETIMNAPENDDRRDEPARERKPDESGRAEPRRVRRASDQARGETGRLALLLAPILALFAALALAILVGALGGDEDAVYIDFDRRVDVTVAEATRGITYAYLPQYSHTASYERHHKLVDYLRKETGLSIRQVYPDTFEDHIKMVGDGAIDISFVNPFVYVQINERYGAQAFARIVGSEEDGGFWGEILVRADNKTIRTLGDVRGKRWIAVDPSSAGGYLFPLGHFLENGLRKRDFAEVAFAPGPGGKQEKVVLGVLSGKYDVGTVRDGTRALLADRIDMGQIRVLAVTREYPNWLFAARRGLNPEILMDVKKALLSLDRDNPGHREILDAARFEAIHAAVDADFDPVRELVARLAAEGEVAP